MHTRHLTIANRSMERKGDTWIFRVRGNGILFEQKVPNAQLNEESIQQVNESFRNSLRYVKHFGGYPDKNAEESDMRAMLETLTQTDTGIGIKVRQDIVKEFAPFAL